MSAKAQVPVVPQKQQEMPILPQKQQEEIVLPQKQQEQPVFLQTQSTVLETSSHARETREPQTTSHIEKNKDKENFQRKYIRAVLILKIV